MKIATFKAILRDDSDMVAGMAALEGGPARFFVRQDQEAADVFVGRISAWVKDQGGESLQMQPPDLLPAGIDVPTVIAEIRRSFGICDDAPADAFDIPNAELIPSFTTLGVGPTGRIDN